MDGAAHSASEAAAQRSTLQSVFATALDDDAARTDVEARLEQIRDEAALARLTHAVTDIYTSTADGDADERNAKLRDLCPLIADLADRDEGMRRNTQQAQAQCTAPFSVHPCGAERAAPPTRLDAQALERINIMSTPHGSHSGASPQRVVDNKVPLKVALAYTAAHGPAPRLVPSQRSRSPDISPVAHETPAPDVIAHVASADAEAAAVRLLQLALAHGRGGAQTRCPPVSFALRGPDTVKTGASLLAWPCGRAGSSTPGAGGLRSFRVPDVPGATEDLSGGDAGRVGDVHAPSPRDVHWCVVTGQPRAPATARAGSSALENLLPWPATVAHLLDAQGLLVVMQDKVEDRGCGPVPQLMLSTTAMTATALAVPLTGWSRRAMWAFRSELPPRQYHAPSSWQTDDTGMRARDLHGLALVCRHGAYSIAPTMQAVLVLCSTAMSATMLGCAREDISRASALPHESGDTPLETVDAPSAVRFIANSAAALAGDVAPVSPCAPRANGNVAPTDAAPADAAASTKSKGAKELSLDTRGVWMQKLNRYKQQHDVDLKWHEELQPNASWTSQLIVEGKLDVHVHGYSNKKAARDAAARLFLQRRGATDV